MMYFFFYWLLKLTTKLYFKKIRVYDYENVSPYKPLIICANHGNSFMDAILMAVIFKRKLHFLARADVFNTPFKRWFLRKINMMPVYRIRDGREVLKNNDAIFDRCQNILEHNGAILIFPEGNCVVEKRLRTFKTGFVQMAFASKMQDLQVLPVTINYSNPMAFYSQVSFQFQRPVQISLIKEEAEQDYIKFSKILISKTIESISNDMLIIPEGYDEIYEQALEINLNDIELGFVLTQLDLLKILNGMRLDDKFIFNDLKGKLIIYYEKLKKLGIDDKTVFEQQKNHKILIIIALPLVFTVKAINYLPATLINYIIDNKIKQFQFKGAVKMILGMLVYLIYVPLTFFFILQFNGILVTFFLLYLLFSPSLNNKIDVMFKRLKKEKHIPKLMILRNEIKTIINL